MLAKQDPPRKVRVRASSRALDIVLSAIAKHGLPVDNIRITGGQIEIHCGHVDTAAPSPDHGGLKDW